MGRTPGARNKPKGTTTVNTDTASKPTMPQIDPGAATRVGRAVTVAAPAPKSVIGDMANRYGMEPSAFEAALRATVVPKDCSPAQFAAFLMVAKEYNLNPLTKEIYAFPSRGGGIVPIVSVDGWINLVNSQGQCNGFSFEMEHDGDKLISCTCSMHRKDRAHPVVVTEYYAECYRPTDPWKMKHRMLRHKSLIQAARYAFGFSGIYDEDEGAKIAEIDPNRDAGPPRTISAPAEPAAERDAGPPRAIAPPAEPADPEEARDGTPPPRQTKTDDKISSGPPRTTAAAAPKPAAPKPAAPPKDTGPTEKPVTPYKIPGTGESYETWSAKYIDLLRTSEDTATAYKWIDVNSEPLDRINKGKPSQYAEIKKATEQTMQALRDAQEKAAKKAAKPAAKPAPEPISDMDDGTGKGPPGDMDADDFDNLTGAGSGPEQPPVDPESILAAIDAELAAVEDPDQLQSVWDKTCDPLVDKLDFPGDQDAAQGLFNKHEKRLGGD